MKIIKDYLKKLFELINKEEMKVLPGHLAFFLILSLIPCITLIGMLCNIFGISVVDMVDFFSNIIPRGVAEVIDPFMKMTSKGSIIIYFLIGFILASNGAHAIISTSNTLYKIKGSNYIEDRIKALFLIILLMFLFIFILIVLAFGNIIVKFILSLEIFNNISASVYNLFVFFKWPIAFFIIFIILKLIYTITPDKKIASKSVTKGSIFTTVGWLFITAIYSYYANNIAHYDLFYGSLSNIVILMMWIYIVAYIFVIGIAINVNNYMEENVTN